MALGIFEGVASTKFIVDLLAIEEMLTVGSVVLVEEQDASVKQNKPSKITFCLFIIIIY